MKFNKTLLLLLLCHFIIQIINCKNLNTSNSNKIKRKKSKTSTKGSLLTTIKKETKKDEYGEGSIFFLDRHELSCSIGVLTDFSLVMQGPYKYQYNYSCVQPAHCDDNCIAELTKSDANTCKNLSTTPADIEKEDKKSLKSLDKHELKCPDEFLLTGFHMQSKRNPNKIFYNYRCCPSKVQNCKAGQSEWKPFGDNSVKELDKLKVGHVDPSRFGLKDFKVQLDLAKNTFSYHYTACEIVG